MFKKDDVVFIQSFFFMRAAGDIAPCGEDVNHPDVFSESLGDGVSGVSSLPRNPVASSRHFNCLC